MMTVMKDSQEGQPECGHLCTKGNSCVLGVTFGLGSLSVAFTHWEVVCRVEEHQHQLAHLNNKQSGSIEQFNNSCLAGEE